MECNSGHESPVKSSKRSPRSSSNSKRCPKRPGSSSLDMFPVSVLGWNRGLSALAMALRDGRRIADRRRLEPVRCYILLEDLRLFPFEVLDSRENDLLRILLELHNPQRKHITHLELVGDVLHLRHGELRDGDKTVHAERECHN